MRQTPRGRKTHNERERGKYKVRQISGPCNSKEREESTTQLNRKHRGILYSIIKSQCIHTAWGNQTANEERLATARAPTQAHFHVNINIQDVWRGGGKGGKSGIKNEFFCSREQQRRESASTSPLILFSSQYKLWRTRGASNGWIKNVLKKTHRSFSRV